MWARTCVTEHSQPCWKEFAFVPCDPRSSMSSSPSCKNIFPLLMKTDAKEDFIFPLNLREKTLRVSMRGQWPLVRPLQRGDERKARGARTAQRGSPSTAAGGTDPGTHHRLLWQALPSCAGCSIFCMSLYPVIETSVAQFNCLRKGKSSDLLIKTHEF